MVSARMFRIPLIVALGVAFAANLDDDSSEASCSSDDDSYGVAALTAEACQLKVQLLQTKVQVTAASMQTVMRSSRLQTSIPPILFVKTHKTGGSTMANIIHRIGDANNMTFLLPASGNKLGWPGGFPGDVLNPEQPAHQYDIICSHAVYSPGLMRAYLAPNPFVVTILRYPINQIVSQFFYASGNSTGKNLPPEAFTANWAYRLSYLRNRSRDFNITHVLQNWAAHSIDIPNPQAYDLGWSDEVPDQEFETWIDGLNIDLVMLTEYYNEGLVLLRRKLGLTIPDVSSVRFKSQGLVANVDEPSVEEFEEIRNLYNRDFALYTHFNNSFWREWASYDVDLLLADLHDLSEQNELLADACAHNKTQFCSWQFRLDEGPYNDYLRQEQRTRLSAQA